METRELLMTAARAVAVYALILGIVRFLGKRTVGNFSAFDLLVALMLGEIVDEMIYGDVRFIQGTVAMVTIGALSYADSWLSYWDHGMEAVLEGKPTIVVKHGEFHRPGMREERMNEKDVLGALRTNGVRDMREVEYALVEHDGSVSVVHYEWAEPVTRADIDQEMSRQETESTGRRLAAARQADGFGARPGSLPGGASLMDPLRIVVRVLFGYVFLRGTEPDLRLPHAETGGRIELRDRDRDRRHVRRSVLVGSAGVTIRRRGGDAVPDPPETQSSELPFRRPQLAPGDVVMREVVSTLATAAVSLLVIAAAVFGGGDRSTFVPVPEAAAESFAHDIATHRFDLAMSFLAAGTRRLETPATLRRRFEPVRRRRQGQWRRQRAAVGEPGTCVRARPHRRVEGHDHLRSRVCSRERTVEDRQASRSGTMIGR